MPLYNVLVQSEQKPRTEGVWSGEKSAYFVHQTPSVQGFFL
jgi:hypothetical protein